MTYSEITSLALISTILFDMFITKTSLLTTRAFWASYGIIFPFQLITNWWLTSRQIVLYDPEKIIGLRVAGAPIEDLLFGFAMIVATLSLWVYRSARARA